MKLFVEKNFWRELFKFGVLIKGFNGILETISGLLVLLLSKVTFSYWFYLISRNELLEDPNDRLINFLAQAFKNISSNTKMFAAIYILAHGLLNVFLAIQLFRKRLWAYLFTIGAVLIFMSYQVYRISVHHSVVLTAITIFDALFIILVWHEYKYHKKQGSQNRFSN